MTLTRHDNNGKHKFELWLKWNVNIYIISNINYRTQTHIHTHIYNIIYICVQKFVQQNKKETKSIE